MTVKKIGDIFSGFKNLECVILGLSLALFFLHGALYIFLIIARPEFVVGTFLDENFLLSFRWLDPVLWVLWAVGILIFVRAGIFLVTRRPFLVLAAIFIYGICIGFALVYGFLYGLTIFVVAFLLVLCLIWFDRWESKMSRFL